MNNMSLGIIGLGLMGGSLALSAKKIPFISKIIASDHNEKHRKEAMELNLVDEFVEFEKIKECDIIILAIPVNGVISTLSKLDGIKESATVIDLGSTKELIVKSVPKEFRKNFVAAHPMTGTENFGPKAAIEDLYDDKIVVLCDLEDSGEFQKRVAVELFSALGMQLHYMHAHEHDRHAAFISHMPHAISFSIANTVMAQEDKDNILTLAAGGFRSMSRLAKSSPHMWEDIFRQNSKNLLEAIELFEEELSNMKEEIKTKDFEALNRRMQDANKLQSIFK
jgi:prephenate dehydrogenase